MNLLFRTNLGFLAFIPSTRREDRRINRIVHLLTVTGAGCLCVNERMREGKEKEEGNKTKNSGWQRVRKHSY